MYKVVYKRKLDPNIFLMDTESSRVSQSAKLGQPVELPKKDIIFVDG